MRRLRFGLKWAGALLATALAVASVRMPASPARAEDGQLELTSVQPAQAANDVDTPIEISGSGFSNDGGSPLVFLGAVALPQAAWVSESRLTAVVPWGLAAGAYSLRVVNPDGGEAALDAAFEATQGVGEWNTSAMDGGPVQAVIPISNTTGLLYAYSGTTSAIYKSTDSGAHWATVGHAAGQFFTSDTAQPANLYLNNQQSTDGGATWRDLLEDGKWPGTDQGPGSYTQVFPDPVDPTTLFLAAADIPADSGSPSGLLRSTDFGQTWETAETNLLADDTHATAMAFAGGTIYLGTRAGNLYQSGDGGTSWARIGGDRVLPSIGILQVNPYEPDELWIATHFSVTPNAQLAKIDLGDPDYTVTPVPAWPDESYPKTLAFLDEDTLLIASHWDNGWISEDDGASWDLFQPAATGKPGYWLAVDPWDSQHKTFYIADEQYGVQKTADRGLTWVRANLGLHAMSPNYLEVDPANPSRVYAKISENGWPGIFISGDGGQSWDFSSLEPASSGTRPVVSMLAVSEGRVFAGAHGNDLLGYGPQLYISEDQGSSWANLKVDATPVYTDSFHMPWALEADPQQPDTLLLTAVIGNRELTADQYVSEIYRSTDQGGTWTRANLETKVGHSVNNLAFLGFDPHNPDTVYAAGDHEILKSNDNGVTWSTLLTDANGRLGGPIAVEPVAPYRVYVGDLVSSDGGETWNPANLPIGPSQMIFVPGSDTLYVAGDGLAVSYDGGTTWQTPAGALASAKVNALAVARSDERTVIYAGTPGGEALQAYGTAAQLATQGLASLEAGVYRLTKVGNYLFLPLAVR